MNTPTPRDTPSSAAVRIAELEAENARLRAELEAFRASEERFQGTLDNMVEGCQIIDRQWRYVYVNAAAAAHGRRTREELLGRSLLECYPGFDQTPVFTVMRRCMEERVGARVKNEFVAPDGTRAWFELIVQPAEEGIFILSLDVTEREQSVTRLRESEERFRELTENIDEVFWISDPERGVLYISPAYEKIWGQSCESLYANIERWPEAIHPADRARVLESMHERYTAGTYDETYRIIRSDGEVRWIRARAYPVRNDRGQVHRLVGTATDITVQKHRELLAAVAHAITAVLAEAAPLAETARRVLEIVCRDLDWDLGDLWIVDRGAKRLRFVDVWHAQTFAVDAFVRKSRELSFGKGEGLPGRVWEQRAPRWVEEVARDPQFRRKEEAAELGLRGALAFPIMLRHDAYGVMEFFSLKSRPPDEGTMALFASLGTQLGQFIERKQLEEQFRQAQKMEAIGTLAGGIAHDFNNVLGAINGYTELARMEIDAKSPAQEYLAAVADGGRRATELVRQILAFSRLQDQERKPVQLWTVVEEAIKLLRATIPTSIQFDISLVRDGPTVLADPTQVHQVIMNLATNAAHAMKDRPGRLGLTLEQVAVDHVLVALHPGLRPGNYMRLSVSDTGHGMNETTLSRIFDPFFTTKGPGEGTGLGLAVVHGIMQNHDGVVTVYSRPGKGTCFTLYFPAQAADLELEVSSRPETPRGSGQRILVVDDEPMLAAMTKTTLERLGYAAEAFTSPEDALQAVLATPDKYALVLTDLSMPGMSGTDLAREVLRRNPQHRIVLTTGYNASLTPERVRGLGIRELVLKPLTVHALGQAMQRALQT